MGREDAPKGRPEEGISCDESLGCAGLLQNACDGDICVTAVLPPAGGNAVSDVCSMVVHGEK